MNLFHSTIYESSSSSLISSLRTFSSISLTKNSLNIFHFSCYLISCNSQFSDSFRNPKSVFAKEYLAILRNMSKDAINWFSDQHNFVNSYKSCGLYMQHSFESLLPLLKCKPCILSYYINSPVSTTFVGAPPQLWRPDILKIANYPLKTLENLFLFGN